MFKDMVVTHLFQILGFMAMEPPTALESVSISREENTGLPVAAPARRDRRWSPRPVRRLPRPRGSSARLSDRDLRFPSNAKSMIGAWAGVPFYLQAPARSFAGASASSPSRSASPPSQCSPKGLRRGHPGGLDDPDLRLNGTTPPQALPVLLRQEAPAAGAPKLEKLSSAVRCRGSRCSRTPDVSSRPTNDSSTTP